MPVRADSPRRASAGAQALAASAARRFYIDGRSKIEIAQQLGVSRFKVARLLAQAQEEGLVHIEVNAPPSLDEELADALQARYGLTGAYVVRPEDLTPAGRRQAVAEFTAGLLEETVTAADVVGLAWGRMSSLVAGAVRARLGCRFVQLSGAPLRAGREENAVDVVRRVAAATGSAGTTFYAPLVVPDVATAEGLRAQGGIHEALDELDQLTKAVLSVGSWQSGESTVVDSLGPEDSRALAAAGVVAEITGVLLGADGQSVEALADRVVGITGPQLRAVPDVLVMACGDVRAAATVAVLRSGIASTMVTHDSLARAVLAFEDPAP